MDDNKGQGHDPSQINSLLRGDNTNKAQMISEGNKDTSKMERFQAKDQKINKISIQDIMRKK